MAEEVALTRLFAAAALAATASGCVDPEDSFEAYNGRERSLPPLADGGADAGPCGQPAPEQIAPEYVLTMSMRLTPGQAFLSRGTATAERVGDQLSILLRMSWLAAGDRATPVGDAFDFGPILVDTAGNATSEPKLFTMPTEANPALCGIVATATTAINGTFCQPPAGEPYARVACGTVEGALHTPIEQDFAQAGAVFRIEAVEPGGGLPETMIGCAGDPLMAPQCQ